ncbi:MAG: type II secretion system protein [Flavobacteriales bacterium]|nr:type II secretion system protein [Flavobacteriales bacterium]
MSRKKQHIEAFTIFEVTVVLAIMGVLIGLIAVSVNRFNEQLKMTGDINQELNEWFAFRSNLWSELYSCDSINSQGGELLLFENNKVIRYKLEEENVMRSTGFDWQDTKTKAESIRLEEVDEKTTVIFDFKWKGDLMTLSYYFEPDVKNKINDYFAHLE